MESGDTWQNVLTIRPQSSQGSSTERIKKRGGVYVQDVLSDLYWAHRSDANVRNLVWREGEVSLDSLLEQDSASLAFEPNPVR